MNSQTYPAGRWTSRAAATRQGVRTHNESVATLRQAPLRELFWAAEESGIVCDARLRLETLLANAWAAAPLAPYSTESAEGSALVHGPAGPHAESPTELQAA